MMRTDNYCACPRCGLPCSRDHGSTVGGQHGPWVCENCGWHESTNGEWRFDAADVSKFVTIEIRVPPPVTVAPVCRIAYCRVCDKKISAETAAANGGCCWGHGSIGTRWQASDDYRR